MGHSFLEVGNCTCEHLSVDARAFSVNSSVTSNRRSLPRRLCTIRLHAAIESPSHRAGQQTTSNVAKFWP